MITAAVKRVNAECSAFTRHHGLTVVAAGTNLDLGDPIGAGAFGAVHPVHQPRSGGAELVAKVFDPDQLAAGGGLGPIIASVDELYGALDGCGRTDWPNAVLALPFELLTAAISGREHLVALMLDLSSRGYEAAPIADQSALASYRKRTLDERTAVAASLCERFELLAAIGFVHGDLNPENILWNPSTLDAQVIDFDSGVVAANGSEHPRTPGKQDACMPPEVQAPSLPGGVDLSAFTPESERWSYASLIGYLLFSVHPAFFLNECSPTSLKAYAAAPERWPEIDERGPLFTRIAQNQGAYRQILPVFNSASSEIVELFGRLFDAGIDASARPTADEWLAGLRGLSLPPDIRVDVSDDIVLEGDDVVVSWAATNATHVELDPGGRASAKDSRSYVAKEHFRVRVTAFNAFGKTTVDGPVIRVAPLPKIEEISIPASPRISVPQVSIAAHLQSGDPRRSGYLPAPPSLTSIFSPPLDGDGDPVGEIGIEPPTPALLAGSRKRLL